MNGILNGAEPSRAENMGERNAFVCKFVYSIMDTSVRTEPSDPMKHCNVTFENGLKR